MIVRCTSALAKGVEKSKESDGERVLDQELVEEWILVNLVRDFLMFLVIAFGALGLWMLPVAYRQLGWWID